MTANMNTTRACDDCGQVTDYEPCMVGPWDLFSTVPHFCQACEDKRIQAEQAATAERLRAKRESAWQATVPKKYRETDLSHPHFPRALWQRLKTWDLGRNVGLIGKAGKGKTRLLALLAKRAIADDLFVGWCPATSFQWAAQNQWDDTHGQDAKKWLRRWQECAVLFLDDLGKHRWTEAVESEFFALVDLRSSRGMPTHWSMNPLPDDEDTLTEKLHGDARAVIAKALDPSGAAAARPRFAPIISRLVDETNLLPVK